MQDKLKLRTKNSKLQLKMQNYNLKPKNQTRGGVLLLSLLIMTGVVTISLATGTLIMNEITQSSQLDRAIVAYYAAESAVERSLYQARKATFDPVTFSSITDTLDNNAEYEVVAQDTENVIYKTLNHDETLQLDFYNPHSLTSLDNPIHALRFYWAGVSGSWLEVRWIPWTIAGVLNPEISDRWYERGVEISLIESPYVMDLDASSTYLYTVRITARHAQVTNLEITAYDQQSPQTNPDCTPLGPSSPCIVGMPGRARIKGLGEYPSGSAEASRQAILVTMPEVAPLSGLYDYVLFSEQPINKGN